VNTTIQLTNATYSSEAYFGWQVIFSATSTSNTTIELSAVRTMAATFSAEYCSPNCAHPTIHGSLSLSGWETDQAYANLTTIATVTEYAPGVLATPGGGTLASAVGILNASSASQGNLTEKLSVQASHGGVTQSATGVLYVSGTARSSIDFGPAGFGLVPWNVIPGMTWNSTGAYIANGAWNVNYLYSRTLATGVVQSGSGHPNATVTSAGPIYLKGIDLGNITLRDGETVPRIVLVIYGPFDDFDAIFLVPHDFDLFSSAPHEWSGNAFGAANVATSEVDFGLDGVHHSVKIAAAVSTYGSVDNGLGAGSVPSGMSVAVSPSATGSANTPVQGQPESAAQAQQASKCLLGLCTGSASVARVPMLLGAVVAGLIAATGVVTVAIIEWRVWSRRRASQGKSMESGLVSHASIPRGAYEAVPPTAAPTGSTAQPQESDRTQ
jgi:hypothetical protein